jgi:hypothetical protein
VSIGTNPKSANVWRKSASIRSRGIITVGARSLKPLATRGSIMECWLSLENIEAGQPLNLTRPTVIGVTRDSEPRSQIVPNLVEMLDYDPKAISSQETR